MSITTVAGFIKTFWSILCSIMLIISGSAATGAGPDEAELIDTQTFVMTDALIRAQGMTTDGDYYYFSSNFFMLKTTLEGEIVRENLAARPGDLLLKGSNHIGGISMYNGKIYAAVEDGDGSLSPNIVIYDPETLEPTGERYLLPQELHIDGVPWCAVDASRGYLYTAEWSHATQLNVFALDTMQLVKTVPLTDGSGSPAELHRIQGSEVYNGTLYCASDIEDTHPVYEVNPDTGVVKVLFNRNLGEAEAEGMTILEDGSGGIIFVSMDIGQVNGTPINVHIRKYIIK